MTARIAGIDYHSPATMGFRPAAIEYRPGPLQSA